MLRLVSALDGTKFCPRTYVCARTDSFSIEKTLKEDGEATVETVPRAREVKQGWASTVLTTIYASVSSYVILLRTAPDLVLCNGPGTCVPFCLAAWLNNKLGISDTKTVFVESVCRVRTLSLSAKILLKFVDEMLVQWPEMEELHKGVTYVDRFT